MPDFLTRKLGPFPVGIWLVILAGGLGIGLYSRRTTFTARGTNTAEDISTTTAGGTMQGGNAGAPSSQPAAGGVNGLGLPILGTNEEWYVWAYSQLVARGFSAGGAADALTMYLQGQALTEQQQRIVDSALQYAGPTPQLLPPVARTPVTPVAPNTPTKPSNPSTQNPSVPVATVINNTPAPVAKVSQTQAPYASIIERLSPQQAVQVPNPIAGDKSAVVVGRTSDGNAYIYGGSQSQATSLVQQAPKPLALPRADGIGRTYTTPEGFKFSYG